jgi:hypothetical protein
MRIYEHKMLRRTQGVLIVWAFAGLACLGNSDFALTCLSGRQAQSVQRSAVDQCCQDGELRLCSSETWSSRRPCAPVLRLTRSRHGKAKPPTPGEIGGRYRRRDIKEVYCLRSISFTTGCEGSPPFAVDVAHPFYLVLVGLPYRRMPTYLSLVNLPYRGVGV